MPGIHIGKEMAHSLKVNVGDRLKVVRPLAATGAHRPDAKTPFRVAGRLLPACTSTTPIRLHLAERPGSSTFPARSRLEVKTNDIDDTRQITSILAALDGYPYRTKTGAR
jgi:ABC-type lipoprotein release transport system permease subunit